MLCAPLDWQYAELPSSASDAVLCSVLVRKMPDINQIEGKKEKKTCFSIKTRDLVCRQDDDSSIISAIF